MMRGIIVTEHSLACTNILIAVEELDRMVAFNGSTSLNSNREPS